MAVEATRGGIVFVKLPESGKSAGNFQGFGLGSIRP